MRNTHGDCAPQGQVVRVIVGSGDAADLLTKQLRDRNSKYFHIGRRAVVSTRSLTRRALARGSVRFATWARRCACCVLCVLRVARRVAGWLGVH